MDKERGGGSAPVEEPGGAGSAVIAGGAAGIARLREAAGKGDPQAMYLLGVAHAQGRFVAKDDAEAAVWFGRAAARDHLGAKVSLGYCLATGRGVRRDPERAYMLLREAADAGDAHAFELAERVASRMHGELLRRCERELKRRRILRAAARSRSSAAPSSTDPAPSPPGRDRPRKDDGCQEEAEIIEIDVPDA